MNPEVTVVIPTRNRISFLPGTLATALAQVEIELEVVVVDDCSSDGTQAYLASLEDPRLRSFRHDPWGGVSAARNRGIQEARGEWIAFLDDDDRWHQRWVRSGIDAARAHDADFAYGDAVMVDESGRTIEVLEAPDPDRLAAELNRESTIATPSAVVASADLLRRTGGFDGNLSYAADWDMWLRFVAAGRGQRCAGIWIEYVQHPGSMLIRDKFDVPAEIEYLRVKHPEVTLEASAFGLWVAKRYREEGKRFRASGAYLRQAVRERSLTWLLRGLIVLFGERVMAAARRIKRRIRRRPHPEPTRWGRE
jgi:glycosyltransferase involved in cell wall biosynthesis